MDTCEGDDARGILALARHGVQFGSHPASHTAVDRFTSRELTGTLTRHA
jgi:hypothetical protein